MNQNGQVKLPLVGDEITALTDLVFMARGWIFPTQKEAADYLNLSESTISRYENGRIRLDLRYLAYLIFQLNKVAESSEVSAELGNIGGESYRLFLLNLTNNLLTNTIGYGRQTRFQSWAMLQETAVAYERVRLSKVEAPDSYAPDQGSVQDISGQVDVLSNDEDEETKAEDTSGDNLAEPTPVLQPWQRLSIWGLSAGLLMMVVALVIVALSMGYLTQVFGGGKPQTTPIATQAAVIGTPTILVPATVEISNVDLPCGTRKAIEAPNAFHVVRSAGVIAYGTENSDGAILSNNVRSIAVDKRGVWIGYFQGPEPDKPGVGQFDGKLWADCEAPGTGTEVNINDILVDGQGRVWAAAEYGGILMLDGKRQWHQYTRRDGLPTDNTFGVDVDLQGNVWASTWAGVAKFNESAGTWSVPYEEGTSVISNHSDVMAFQANGDIWVGHLGQGVSHYSNSTGTWSYYNKAGRQLRSDDVFDIQIIEDKSDSAHSEVWFATLDGLTRYQDGTWATYHSGDGLPDNRLKALDLDRYGRLWFATEGGVGYRDGITWMIYNKIPTHDLAIGAACIDCPYGDDTIWTGTEAMGLTYSRLPLPLSTIAIDIISIRYRNIDRTDDAFTDNIVLAPGQRFVAQIVVSPRVPFTLLESRGDLLISLEDDESKLYGAYVHMPVKGTVESGQRYTFSDFIKPYVAPEPENGAPEQTFTIPYRVWMETKYVGPTVNVTFTVRRPVSATPTPTVPLCEGIYDSEPGNITLKVWLDSCKTVELIDLLEENVSDEQLKEFLKEVPRPAPWTVVGGIVISDDDLIPLIRNKRVDIVRASTDHTGIQLKFQIPIIGTASLDVTAQLPTSP